MMSMTSKGLRLLVVFCWCALAVPTSAEYRALGEVCITSTTFGDLIWNATLSGVATANASSSCGTLGTRWTLSPVTASTFNLLNDVLGHHQYIVASGSNITSSFNPTEWRWSSSRPGCLFQPGNLRYIRVTATGVTTSDVGSCTALTLRSLSFYNPASGSEYCLRDSATVADRYLTLDSASVNTSGQCSNASRWMLESALPSSSSHDEFFLLHVERARYLSLDTSSGLLSPTAQAQSRFRFVDLHAGCIVTTDSPTRFIAFRNDSSHQWFASSSADECSHFIATQVLSQSLSSASAQQAAGAMSTNSTTSADVGDGSKSFDRASVITASAAIGCVIIFCVVVLIVALLCRQRCSKQLPCGHKCNVVHQKTDVCPPCEIEVDYTCSCGQTERLACHISQQTKHCHACAARVSSSHVETDTREPFFEPSSPIVIRTGTTNPLKSCLRSHDGSPSSASLDHVDPIPPSDEDNIGFKRFLPTSLLDEVSSKVMMQVAGRKEETKEEDTAESARQDEQTGTSAAVDQPSSPRFPPPDGEDWALDTDTGYYWSDTNGCYMDPNTGHYYYCETEDSDAVWWVPEKEAYMDDEEHTAFCAQEPPL